MSLNEFKTNMLLMGWAYEQAVTAKKCQTYLWRSYPHIVQLKTCITGPPITITIFKNWDSAMRGKSEGSSRMNFTEPRKALNTIEDLV